MPPDYRRGRDDGRWSKLERELAGQWPDFAGMTAAAFSAHEAIRTGLWDEHLLVLAGAIRVRLGQLDRPPARPHAPPADTG